MSNPDRLIEDADLLFRQLDALPLDVKVKTLNTLRHLLHLRSPFCDEPVDFVQWLPSHRVQPNDYNPNAVAPPEMALLAHSVRFDGYTMPIVTHAADGPQVIVDGFHRYRVGIGTEDIRKRLHGYLPVSTIRTRRGGLKDRIASTIRHNRARGIHSIDPMIAVVVALLRDGWQDADVARELGMDPDEVFRFRQVAGLPGLFRDRPYSQSWD